MDVCVSLTDVESAAKDDRTLLVDARGLLVDGQLHMRCAGCCLVAGEVVRLVDFRYMIVVDHNVRRVNAYMS